MCPRCWLAAALTAASVLTPCAASADDSAAVAQARAYFVQLRAGEYAACVEAADDAMRAALPADKLAAVWRQITAAYGPYVAEQGAQSSRADALAIVDLACRFERGNLRVRITLNADMKVAGLFFTPLAADVPYRAPDYVNTQGFREAPVTVDAGGWPLAGTLSCPHGDGPFPAVVLVHGSGPHDQDESIQQTKPFRDLAWGLASRGIAVLRYEKRTHKYGDRMKPAEITVAAEVIDDALAAARLLRNQPGIATNGVFVLGHSLGATAAPSIGAQDPRIAGLIMIAPAARPIHALIEDQLTYIANLDGQISPEEKEQIDTARQAGDKLRAGDVQPQDTLLGAPVAYWRNLDALAPLQTAKTYPRPMLLIFGGRDYQVTAIESDLWKSALADHGHARLQVFPELDHLMHAGTGPSRPEDYSTPGYVDAQVIAVIADWVKTQHRPPVTP